MRALVTGAAGFIGSHLTDRLLADGWGVVGVDNYASGRLGNLANARQHASFREVLADVRAVGPGLFDGVDAVFHQAAKKKQMSDADPRQDLLVNALGTFNVLDCAARAGVVRFVYASTGSVYGSSPKRVDAVPSPLSFYGVSKLAAERYAGLFDEKMNVTILRYFNVYGPRQTSTPGGGVVSIFLRRLLEGRPPIIFGDGRQTHSFTWVEDVVEANLKAGTGTYNVASGRETSIERLLEMCRNLVLGPEPVRERWQHVEATPFDVEKSVLDIDWTPLHEGLRRTAEHLRECYG